MNFPNNTATSLLPGELWTRLIASGEQARAAGALLSLPATNHWIEDQGVRFLVRQLEVLARKPDSMRTTGKAVNPFLPYDKALFVGDLDTQHVALLNKFNVVDHHLLLVTRDFEAQESALNRADFSALAYCLGEYPGLGFYNSGAAAGASQRHKHLQYVPLPIAPEGSAIPIEPLLQAAKASSAGLRQPAAFPPLPWRCAYRRLGSASSGEVGGEALLDTYHRLLVDLDLQGPGAPKPYNLLVTREWMMMVPRRREGVEGISVNALGFAGTLLVKDDIQLRRLQALGPCHLLSRVGQEADQSAPG